MTGKTFISESKTVKQLAIFVYIKLTDNEQRFNIVSKRYNSSTI